MPFPNYFLLPKSNDRKSSFRQALRKAMPRPHHFRQSASAVFLMIIVFAPLCHGGGYAVGVGKPAPPLVTGKWLRGERTDQFRKGHVYVIESWATWCGPCIKSIPRLSSLQKKYAGKVTVIGIDVWEEDSSSAEPFVEKQGKNMTYDVAQDFVPPGLTFFEGNFAKEWIEGAGKYSVGIPLAFIVNNDGVIAWIGHPSELDEPLDQVVAGRWDLDSASKKYDDEMKKASKSEPFKVAYYSCSRNGDYRGAEAACESLLQMSAEEFYEWAGREYELMYSDAKQPGRALEFARSVIQERFQSNPRLLANLARTIARVSANKDSSELSLASTAAKRACELTEMKKGFALGALARVLFAQGRRHEAIELQKKAIQLAHESDEKDDMQSLLNFMEGK
jgi:thiol-disulfide isomerase/thioredoxin